ncbi:PAS domain S-box protein [Halorientalis marina]|uniref:PAS domain S-box protein n=1 Tax=Halorientalis marina TaxID=2931976 RepID=UPI001FF408D9|nr:PAS domain S-box protein [Halorientalis marina]
MVGDDEIASRLGTAGADAGTSLELTRTPPGALPDALDTTDCLLIDQATTDSWDGLVDRATARRPGLPVVVLVAGDFEAVVPTAIEAGATDYLPRSLTETDPAAVTTRIAEYVSGTATADATDAGADTANTDDVAQDAASATDESAASPFASDDQFRLVAENVDEIVYVANEDFSEIEYVNGAYEAVWGRPVAELYEDATAFIEGIDPRDREAFEADFAAMREDIRAGEPAESYEFEFRVEQPDGEVRWVLANGYPVTNETGDDWYVGIAEDVTERRELERTYRELFENVSDGLVVHEPETGEIVDANARFCEMTGYDHDELVGEPVSLVTASDAEYTYDRARELIEQVPEEGAQLFEWRGERKNGETYPVEVHLTLAAFRGTERVLASVRDVSERRETEARFQTIVERIDAGVMLVPEGETEPAYLNPVYEDLTGIPVEELYDPERFVECIHPADRDGYVSDVGAMVEDILAGEADDSYQFEFRFQRPDGETRWFHWTGYPLLEEDNDYSYVGLTTDVTERRERQRRLAAERDRRSVLFENTPDPIMAVEFTDGDPYITEVNSAFEDAFGFEAERVADRPIADVIVPDEERAGYERIREQTLAGEPVEAEVRRETADGVRDFILRVLPFESNDSHHAYVWYTDITERKRRERAIEEERQKYTTLVEQSTDAVVVVRDGQYVFVNDRFCEITGYDEAELLDMPFQDVFTPASRELVEERYERRVAGESPPNQYDVEVETKTGERITLELSVSRIQHEGEPATMANFRDVTERRERERTVEQLQTATERLQGAETTDEVYRIAVETARDVLGLPMTACWRHDDDAERLTYVAGTEPVEEMPDGPVPFTAGDWEYAAFERDAATTYDPSEHHDHNPLDASIIVSLGDHGLLAAGERGREDYASYLVDVTGVLAGHVASALERVHRARQSRESQRRLEAIVDRIDEAIFLAPAAELSEPRPAPEFVSSGYETIWGQSLEGLHETYEEGFFGTLHPDDYDGYRAFVDRITDEVERGTAPDRYSREYRIERPDGEVRWVHSDFYPTEWDDGVSRVVIVSRDVTDRKERERTLESFHDATAALTTADTVTDAGDVAVTAAADVFDIPATAVYRYDEETAELDPTATGPAVPAPGDLPTVSADDTRAWEAFVGETMHRVTVDEAPALDVGAGREALLFPLGGNGVLAVWRTGEAFDTDAASILAATLEAALNRLRGERQLESRRAELEAQTERARRLEAITELTRRVEAAITTQSSRQGIQNAVCAELVDVDPFEAAWIVAAEVGTDRLTPRTVAGIDRDDAERALDGERPDGTDTHPAVEVWETGEPRVVNDLVGGGRRSDWRQLLLKTGVGSVCAVPLAYGGITYGVLTVAADEPDAFGDRVREVLAQLGTSIGYAITAIERQRALESDDTLELEFRGTDMDLPFARLARETGCRVRHERTIRRQDGSVSVYYTLRDDVPADVDETAVETLPGEVEVVSEGDGEAVLERRGSSWFGALISEYGGVLRRGRATDGGVELVVELPKEADTRTIVDRLREEFPALELTAQRQHHETDATPSEMRSRLQRRLSDRQYEALETAHAMGYFEWPRESSGEEVAATLGITQPTVNKHIRLGEGKVFDLLFGSASDTPA